MGGVDDARWALVKDVDGDKSKFEDDGEPRPSGPLRPRMEIPSRCGDCGGDGVVNASSLNTSECYDMRHRRKPVALPLPVTFVEKPGAH